MIAKANDYWVPLLKLMAELPEGQGKTRRVVAVFFDRYQAELDASQLQLKSDARTPKWHNNVEWARLELVRLEYMDSPAYGIWRITSKARDWLAANPHLTHLAESKIQVSNARGQQERTPPLRPVSPPMQTPSSITLAQLESTRQFMPAEDFRQTWGDLYDRLLAEQRAQAITPIDRTRLMNTVIEQVFRIQAFVGGQGNDRPNSEELCDWIYQCYLYGLHREIRVLWPLVDQTQVEPWYFERTKRIAAACKAKTTSERR